ncbi:hypothetical protein F2Q68_00007644 [Brassica cretica]|uniref:FAF domain-containing protein n=1 Tax=Brassica cretica TaxID=69181 RepID=A0A8S9KSC3_BRACR|nr:hypothetical protein F2Q68_00007644 [Brassica cretica]
MMACGLSKSLGFSSSLKKQQEGIVTILGGISSNTSSAPSLRRTFSANWLSHNESSPMKRISSSEKLHASVADEEEGSRSGFDIWAQIQEVKNPTKEIEPDQTDVWSSILTDKKKAESSDDAVPPPYVHPLVKRASSLGEKSLEICTESLGSETGCASYADAEIEKEEADLTLNVSVTMKEEETEAEQESITVPNHTPCMELPRGSFPPPIRSLSSQSGSALHMKTRRDNGRLVLEAVSMPSLNNFSAKRQDGRLLLTFAEISDEPDCEIDIVSDEEDETDELQWSDDEEEEEEEEEVQVEFAYKPIALMYELAPKPIGPITVHRLAHKPVGIPKTNSRWDEFETKTDLSTPVVLSLPPRPRVAQLARSMKPPSTVDDTVGAACFNTCDYSWKLDNTETLGRNTKAQFQAHNYLNKSIDGWINGCKERRRSLLSVEPFCIATS